MPIGNSPDRADVVESGAAQGIVTVNGTPVELKAAGSRLASRQFLVVFNDGLAPIFTGPSASVSGSGANKGIPLFSNQERVFPVGDTPVYAVTLGASSNAIVQEYA